MEKALASRSRVVGARSGRASKVTRGAGAGKPPAQTPGGIRKGSERSKRRRDKESKEWRRRKGKGTKEEGWKEKERLWFPFSSSLSSAFVDAAINTRACEGAG